jgi:error-prone DNA polymerase
MSFGNDTYCELHCHTYYSLLDGASAPEALLDRALALRMPALGITDHDGLYGAVHFWRAAHERGIRPVIGAELTLAHGSHLTLLAETQAGYANLSRLITAGQLAGSKGAPRLSIADIAGHAGGLLCLSGCRQGAVSQALLAGDEALARRAAGKLLEIFGRDRFWIELQRHHLPDDTRLEAGRLALAGWLGVPTVATNDVHYAAPDRQRLHDILTATRYNLAIAELGIRRRPNAEFYLKGPGAMAALFADRPESLQATLAIAGRCSVTLDFAGQRLPAFPPCSAAFPDGAPPGETAFSTLHALCQAGLLARYRPVTLAAVRQLAHELAVIEGAGLIDYFLMVWDIVRFARSQGIRCQGRGSAANSLVAYLLGITPVDPLRHNLLFERFLSERSDTMPDIDIDFAADRRDEVMAYIYQRYGTDHAAMVCNVVTYQWRSAVRDVGRALGYTPEAVDELARRLAHGPESVASLDAQPAPGHPPGNAPAAGSAEPASPITLDGAIQRDGLPLVVELATQLVDTPRHLSVHVGGMLITARPLVDVVPLEWATKPDIVVAQWNKDSVEDAGLIKVDLLALRTLGMVSEVGRLIVERHGQTVDLENLPLDDPAVYRLLAEADTIGCFQVESRAQAQMLPKMQPASFQDLTIQVAIIRPGPIQGGMVHPYLRRRAGQEPVTYLHPLLEPVLQETLGVIIFQEQVIRVAVALAGFTPGEADLLRRAMSRSRSADAMVGLQARFLAGAAVRGVEPAIAEETFRQLRGFATYGFCKSHAAAFALVAYQTLWLKAYYPAEFYCALLNHQPMGFYAPDVVVNDAKRHNLVVLRPDVNASADACTLEERENPAMPALRLGLRYLSGLGEAGRERLLAARGGPAREGPARGDQPFTGLDDFCRRTRLPRPLIADLVRAGALDGLGTARRDLLWRLGALHYDEEALIDEPDDPVDLPPLEAGEALSWDYELLGLAPDDHPLRLLRPGLRARGVLSAAELAGQPAGRSVQVAGLVAVRQSPPTAKGHVFITLEDETGLANLVLRPDLARRERAVLHEAQALLVAGTLQREGKAISLLVRSLQALGPAP